MDSLRRLKKYWVNLALAVIIIASFFLMFFSSRTDSMVVDEKVHISAGYLHVWLGDYTFNPEHPPLLNDLAGIFAQFAKPNLPNVNLSNYKSGDQWDYGELFFYQSGNDVDKIIFWARFPFILLALGLIYLTFIWAKTVFGPKAGLLAAALVGFCPNILAHGRLATTDMLAFFFLLAVWLLRKYLLKNSWKNALLLAVGTALVILAKFSGLVILPIVFLGFVYLLIKKRADSTKIFGQFVLVFIVTFAISWFIYAFSMRGELFTGNWFLGPINKFIQGYQILAEHNAIGHWNYLNGQVNSNGWWYYFPLVMSYKLTIPTLILFGLAIIFSKKIKYLKNHRFLEEALIILPALVFLGAAMASKIDIGIRHVLPLLPFIFIFISRLAYVKIFVLKPIVAGLVLLHVAFGILGFPNYIAYFNQIAGGSSNGIKHLDDSNLDWNQNMLRFAKYYREQKFDKVYEYCWDGSSFSYYGMIAEFLPTTPVSGVVVVCAHQLKMYQAYGYNINWVTQYLPDDIVADGIYVWRFDKHPVQ